MYVCVVYNQLRLNLARVGKMQSGECVCARTKWWPSNNNNICVQESKIKENGRRTVALLRYARAGERMLCMIYEYMYVIVYAIYKTLNIIDDIR